MTGQFDMVLIGVGGQGIGLLSESLARAAAAAGIRVLGVDTHGLAQRGGTVLSHLRLGPSARSPLVRANSADCVIALEIHEALRAGRDYLRKGGLLAWVETSMQPLAVRLGKEAAVDGEALGRFCGDWSFRSLRVETPDLEDSRMENMVILGRLIGAGEIPGVSLRNVESALGDLLPGKLLEENLRLLRAAAASG
jgi:Pyruvate:ferredoxin oxidoreductase and related 2-oxoacid:ferredoxin oxidoreductases, gamma subunit